MKSFSTAQELFQHYFNYETTNDIVVPISKEAEFNP